MFAADRVALVAAALLATLAVLAALAPLIAPYDPADADNAMRFAAPFTTGHLLGTDQQGRDMLSRLLWGGRVSLIVAVVPTALASVAGMALGIVAGWLRGPVDMLIMRVLDVLFAFPLVLLAIVIAGVLRPGIGTEIAAIAVVLIPYVARLARTETLGVVAMPFIEAARAAGGSSPAILARYVAPNVASPIIVYATTLMGLIIVVGSGLSFLGLGVQPPAADWGGMVADGRVALRRAAHVTVLPGLLILAASLAFNFVGDGVRDAIDPRSGTT